MGKYYIIDPIDWSRAFNVPFQSSAADVSCKGKDTLFELMQRETDELVKKYYADCDAMAYGLWGGRDTMFQNADHMVVNEQGAKVATYAGEAVAIRGAEELAKASPGRKFFVLKVRAVSYVAPAPSITTYL